MKPGEILYRFTSKDGREVILRAPRWEDLDDLMEYSNSLVDEGSDIAKPHKVTREMEAESLRRKLGELEEDEAIHLVAEVEGKVVATSDIWFQRAGYSSHVGVIGIGIRRGYRDVSIGTEMLKILIIKAKEMGLKILTLRVFSTNKRAIHVYEKIGFKETGRYPKTIYRDGKYIDENIMVLEI